MSGSGGIKGRAVWGLALLPLVALGACGHSRPGPYVPEVVGVVISTEWTEPNVVARYVLDNDQSFSANIVDKAATTIVSQGGSAVGDLLLAGSGPGRPWLAFLAPAAITRSDLPADCYALNDWGTDDGDWIQADIGLRLRKAPGFDPGLLPDVPGDYVPTAHPGLRYEAVGQTFCVNSQGLVTLRDWGTWHASPAPTRDIAARRAKESLTTWECRKGGAPRIDASWTRFGHASCAGTQ